MKRITVTKIVKEIEFEGVCSEMESKKVSRDNISQNMWAISLGFLLLHFASSIYQTFISASGLASSLSIYEV